MDPLIKGFWVLWVRAYCDVLAPLPDALMVYQAVYQQHPPPPVIGGSWDLVGTCNWASNPASETGATYMKPVRETVSEQQAQLYVVTKSPAPSSNIRRGTPMHTKGSMSPCGIHVDPKITLW